MASEAEIEAAGEAVKEEMDPRRGWDEIHPLNQALYRQAGLAALTAAEKCRKDADLDEWHDAYTKGFVSGLDAEKKRAAGEARTRTYKAKAFGQEVVVDTGQPIPGPEWHGTTNSRIEWPLGTDGLRQAVADKNAETGHDTNYLSKDHQTSEEGAGSGNAPVSNGESAGRVGIPGPHDPPAGNVTPSSEPARPYEKKSDGGSGGIFTPEQEAAMTGQPIPDEAVEAAVIGYNTHKLRDPDADYGWHGERIEAAIQAAAPIIRQQAFAELEAGNEDRAYRNGKADAILEAKARVEGLREPWTHDHNYDRAIDAALTAIDEGGQDE